MTIGAALSGLAAVLLIFFAAYLRTVLSRAEGPGGVLSAAALVGAGVLAVGIAIDATLSLTLAQAAEGIDPAAVQALQALWDHDFIPIALGTAVFLFSVGISTVRHGALPRWLGWFTIVLAVSGLTPVSYLAFLGTVLWVAVVSVLLALRARAAADASQH